MAVDNYNLWKSHERLAISIASKFHRKYPNLLSLDDKKAYANLAVINCLDKWNPNAGTKFSTYVHRAIVLELNRAISREINFHNPGTLANPGKYEIKIKSSSYQEDSTNGGRQVYKRKNSLPRELYRAHQVTYPEAEKKIEFEQRLNYLYKKVPPKHREAIKLILEKGYSIQDAANTIGISREFLRKKIKQGIEDLHKKFGD